jgi:hypothetical protein
MQGEKDSTAAARDREFSILVWAVPLAVMIHNGEEALTMPRWAAENLVAVAHLFQVQIARVPTADEMYAALAMGTVVPLLIALVAHLSGPRTLGLYLLSSIQGIMLANAFVPHLVGTIILRRYTPGVITAVLVIIPFSILWFRCILKRGFADRGPLIIAILAGVLVYPLALAALYKAGGLS